MLVFAHRGNTSQAPENSVLSIIEAQEAGYDGVEVDLRLLGDGTVVVFHDSNLKRLFGRDLRLADMTKKEFKDLKLKGGELALLSELDKYVQSSFWVNLEIKDQGMFNDVAKFVQKHPKTFISVRTHNDYIKYSKLSDNVIMIIPFLPPKLNVSPYRYIACRNNWLNRYVIRRLKVTDKSCIYNLSDLKELKGLEPCIVYLD